MIVLGIDPGTHRVGYGVIQKDGGALRLVAADLLSLKDAGTGRLAAIRRGIVDLIDEYRPEILSIERLYFAKNQKTALAVAQARGVILGAAEERAIPVREFDPVTIKAGVTGYGKADKKAVAKMVGLLLGLDLELIDDVTDALAVAIVGAQNEFAHPK